MISIFIFRSHSWSVTINGVEQPKGALNNGGNRIDYVNQPDGITSNDQYFYGSYCAQADGDHVLRFTGRQHNFFQRFGNIDVSDMTIGASAWCSGSNDMKEKTITLSKNRCYGFEAEMDYWCMFRQSGLVIQLKKPGETDYEYAGITNSIAVKNYDDCIDGFYGENCERSCEDTHCNSRGTCNDKMSGDGYCTCSSGTGPFCDLETDTYFTGKAFFTEYSINGDFLSGNITSYVTSNPYTIPSYPYAKIIVNGKIMIPQNGKYEIRAIGTSPMVLTVNGNTVGSISTDYTCKIPTFDKTTSSISFSSLKRGAISFSIEMGLPCSLHNGMFKLQWKNYRFNRDSSSTTFEDIPIRFIGY